MSLTILVSDPLIHHLYISSQAPLPQYSTFSHLASKLCFGIKRVALTYKHCCYCLVASVVSDSVRPHRWQPTRLPRPWDFPGKSTGVGCHFFLQCMKVKSESEVAQSCPTLCNPMDCSLPGFSVHGIFQARVLEWGAIAFSDIYTTMCKIDS